MSKATAGVGRETAVTPQKLTLQTPSRRLERLKSSSKRHEDSEEQEQRPPSTPPSVPDGGQAGGDRPLVVCTTPEDPLHGISLGWDAIDPPETPIRPSTSSWCLLNPEGCCQVPQGPFAWDAAVVLAQQLAYPGKLTQSPGAAAPAAAVAGSTRTGPAAGRGQSAEPGAAVASLSEDWQPWTPPDAAWQAGQRAQQAQRGRQSKAGLDIHDDLWCAVVGSYGYQPPEAQKLSAEQQKQPTSGAGAAASAAPSLPRQGNALPGGASRLHQRQLMAQRAEQAMELGWYGGTGRQVQGDGGGGGGGGSVKQRARGLWRRLVSKLQDPAELGSDMALDRQEGSANRRS